MPANDLVVEQLAADIADLEFQVVGYRELVKVALAQLHDARVAHAAQQDQIIALREELRRYVAARVSA